MQGMNLLQDFIGSALPEDLPCGVLDRNHLEFGSALFETVPPDLNIAYIRRGEYAAAFGPVFPGLCYRGSFARDIRKDAQRLLPRCGTISSSAPRSPRHDDGPD
jgi:hypothetical protein